MATSTQQKQELFKAIWATAEDLRNSVNGWDFKSYVLGILFYRFISENITNYINRMQREAGDTVIQLPPYLFFGVIIATCIIVLKKSKKENKTLFIDASQLFVHEGNKNKLSLENIEAIIKELEAETDNG